MDFTKELIDLIKDTDYYEWNNMVWIKSKDPAKKAYHSLILNYPDAVMISRDINIKDIKNPPKNYTIIESPNKLNIEKDMHIHEMYLDNKPIRFFLDIDAHNENNLDHIDVLFDAIRIVDYIYWQTFKYLFSWFDVSVWECHRKDKISYHCSFPFYFENIKQLNEFGKLVAKEAKNREYAFIDDQLYGTDKSLRLPFQSKKDKDGNFYAMKPSNLTLNSKILFNNLSQHELDSIPKMTIEISEFSREKKNNIQHEQKETVKISNLNMELKASPNWGIVDDDLRFFLSCVPNDREGQPRDVWINVGITIKNEGGILEDWINWSNQCERYQDQTEDCKTAWDGFNNKGLSLASLIYIAKQYDPDIIKKRKELIKFNPRDVLISGGEISLAKYFMYYHREVLVVSNLLMGFFHWFDNNTKLWEEKDKAFVRNLVSDFYDNEYRKLITKENEKGGKLQKEEERKTHAKFMEELSKKRSSIYQYRTLDNIVRLCLAYNVNEKFIEKLNVKKHLVPLKNGKVLDMKLGKEREREKDDFFTFEMPVNYLGKKAKTPNANKFFVQIMNGNKEAAKYLQKCLGYCITGETSERCLFLFWGEGSNGKSSVMELMNKIMTDNMYAATSKDVFIKHERRGGATPELMKLMDKRLGVYSESEKCEELNEGRLKSLTGNDKISARFLYQRKESDFTPIIKPVMLTNHRPEFNTDDQAMIDRVKYIPFLARFVLNPKEGEYKKDPEFVRKLQDEYLDEVFTFIAKGAIKWYNTKDLKEPKEVMEARQEYINSLDSVGQFINERCEKGEGNTEKTEIYKEYVEYMNEEGKKPENKPEFYKKLRNRGYIEVKIMGKRQIRGLILLSAPKNMLANRINNES